MLVLLWRRLGDAFTLQSCLLLLGVTSVTAASLWLANLSVLVRILAPVSYLIIGLIVFAVTLWIAQSTFRVLTDERTRRIESSMVAALADMKTILEKLERDFATLPMRDQMSATRTKQDIATALRAEAMAKLLPRFDQLIHDHTPDALTKRRDFIEEVERELIQRVALSGNATPAHPILTGMNDIASNYRRGQTLENLGSVQRLERYKQLCASLVERVRGGDLDQ